MDSIALQDLERKLVKHATPTILGIKPANLFTYRPLASKEAAVDTVHGQRAAAETAHGETSADEAARAETAHGECPADEAARDGSPADEAFGRALGRMRERLAPFGIRIEILAKRRTGHLLYVYRPRLVTMALGSPETSAYLAKAGYDTSDLGSCIKLLHQRICGTDLASLLRGTCAFPHEIGFFLGYPHQDVVGFIENEGRDSVCSGCWKVYAHAEDAEECFCRYKECTARCLELHAKGTPLEQLAAVVA